VTNKAFNIPASFASEAEEAEWWYANRERIGDLVAEHGRIVPGRQVAKAKLPECDKDQGLNGRST
jgi:hypothetical protein